MAVKTHVVRGGFSLNLTDAKGTQRLYVEGDTLDLEDAEGKKYHQLEVLKGGKKPPVDSGNQGDGDGSGDGTGA